MVLYNVTVKINRALQTEWLGWMQQQHLPEVVQAGNFEGAQISRLLDQPDDDDPTYVIQYRCADKATLDHYLTHHAPRLRAEHDQKFKGRYVAFRTVMEVL